MQATMNTTGNVAMEVDEAAPAQQMGGHRTTQWRVWGCATWCDPLVGGSLQLQRIVWDEGMWVLIIVGVGGCRLKWFSTA